MQERLIISNRMDPLSPGLRISIGNEYGDLAVACRVLREFLATRGVEEEAAFRAELLLEEALTNIVKYAYADRGAHAIHVEADVEPGRVVLAIADDGLPFDPRSAPPPPLGAPLEDRPVGGVGIHLMRKLSESLEYERAGGWNRLTVRIPREVGE
jgi:serine/threonine-protein kinase RsbW